MSTPLAKTIDRYLVGRGSPMAGFGAAFVHAGNAHGVDPRLLVGIATIESGAGAHEKLAKNPFNWGVHRGQSYGSYTAAINDVAKGLSKNYIAAGLDTPESIVSKYAPSADGNNEANWAKVVSGVMRQLGGVSPGAVGRRPAPAVSRAVTAPPAPLAVPPGRPVLNRQLAANQILQGFIQNQGRFDVSSLGGIMGSSYEAPPLPPAAPAPLSPPGVGAAPPGLPQEMHGKTLVLPTKWKSTHPTDGLADEGFTHAEDIMAHPGTPVGAPTSGTIMRHGSAQGGSSLWLHGDDGRTYWMGHIESNIPVGTKVKRGQVIAQVSADHPRPHVHLDYSTTYGK